MLFSAAFEIFWKPSGPVPVFWNNPSIASLVRHRCLKIFRNYLRCFHDTTLERLKRVCKKQEWRVMRISGLGLLKFVTLSVAALALFTFSQGVARADEV